MKWKEVFERSPPYLLALGAASSFFSALWLAWTDATAAAALLSALFLVCVVLAYFPQLDSLKAFSVDIRLRKSLDRVDEILLKLKNISKVTAKSTYMNVAWANRWGGMNPREKQELLDSVDEQLQEIGVQGSAIRLLSRPHVELIGCDLYNIFYQSARSVFWHHSPQKNPGEIAQKMMEWEAKWRPAGVEALRELLVNPEMLRARMRKLVPVEITEAAEKDCLDALQRRVIMLFEQCVIRNGYSDDTITFLERCAERTSSGMPHAYYEFLMEESLVAGS